MTLPIVVGGFAVEVYTKGRIKSGDIDLICDRADIIPILQELEFKNIDDRCWFSENFDIQLDLQGGTIDIPGGHERIEEVEATKNCIVKIISLTDIIADRISAYASGHSDSKIQALALLRAWHNKVDFNILENVCSQENAISQYREILSDFEQQERQDNDNAPRDRKQRSDL